MKFSQRSFLRSSLIAGVTMTGVLVADAAIIAAYDFGVLTGTRNDWGNLTPAANTIWTGVPWSSADQAYLLNGTTEATAATGVILNNLHATLNATGSYSGLTYSTAYSSGGPDGDLNLVGWLNSAGDTIANWAYFDITAATGYAITLNAISFSGWRNGAGAPDTISFDYSTNGGASWNSFGDDLLVGQGLANGITDQLFSQTLIIQENETVRIRLAPFKTSQGTNTGNWHITGLALDGAVTPVPEPSTYAFAGVLAAGVVGMMIRRKRL